MKVTYTLALPLLSLSTLPLSYASVYVLKEDIVGPAFYTHFDFEAIPDPTHGRVTYVDKPTAIKNNLTYASWDTFVLKTDAKTVLQPAPAPGRNSVRIRSKKTYTTHVAVFDVRHMPQGCGTWPAIWETKEDGWPAGGEIDILEGVNDQGVNAATLHTAPGCTMPGNQTQTGTSGQLDCDTNVNYNTGCGVRFTQGSPNYGPSFNANGGGWFVIERTDQAISVWFWGRKDKNVPVAVKTSSVFIDPKTFGIPTAYFPNTSCAIPKFFSENNIIINLTLCGDWAGQTDVYASSGCPSTCEDFVNSNPTALANAYFNFGAVRVYQK